MARDWSSHCASERTCVGEIPDGAQQARLAGCIEKMSCWRAITRRRVSSPRRHFCQSLLPDKAPGRLP
jgi:hypothetical protein